jgi:uncharacterized membrane protein (UPF0127 family)
MKWVRSTFLILSPLLLAACREDQPSSQPATSVTAEKSSATPLAGLDPHFPMTPQPHLDTKKLWLATNEVVAEIAHTERQITNGLMARTNMGEMEGMLFVFPFPRQLSFWMKNTLLPLSCAYMAADGTILELHDMQPLNTNSIPSSSDQIQYVLEMNQGWFQRHNVSTGVVVQTSDGPFSRVFFRR